MDSRIQAELSQAKPTRFHADMLEHVKGLVTMSRGQMKDYYDKWDAADATYRGERQRDEEDKKACKQGAPEKLVVPLTYAQVQTFVAFALNLLLQREHFYELEGTGEEDHRAAKLAEALLEQNLQHNQFSQILYQFFLDVGRFSMGVVKHSWVRQTETVWEEQPVAQGPVGTMRSMLGRIFALPDAPTETTHVEVEQIKYLGNELRSISPYRFYPDTRLPLTDFQRGEFCASEDEVTRTELARLEADGVYAGTKYVDSIKGDGMNNTDRGKRFRGMPDQRFDGRVNTQIEATVIRTEVQVDIVPSKFILSDGQPMGSSNKPEKWIVVYANDSRIIQCEPMGYKHNHFTYSVAQFSPDQHGLINESITEMVGHLQAVIDWLINSHITNVRKHISNRVVFDPTGIYTEDLRDHKPAIRMKPGVAATGVERYIKQLNVSDVTRNHIADAEVLMKFVSMTTAISDNLMGQYHTGRRSAREAANTATASGTRLRTIIKIIFDTCFLGLGNDMISNLRDGLDADTFVTITGDLYPDWQGFEHFIVPQTDRTKVAINRTHLGKRYDFKLFDGTLPSEKAQQAETLEQTLLAMMRNPDGLNILTQVLGYDPSKLFTEVLTLRGIKHPDRFKLDQVRAMQIQQAQQVQAAQQQAPNPNDPNLNPGGGSGPLPGGPVQGGVPSKPPSFEALAS